MTGLQRVHVGWALAACTLVTAAIALNRGIDLLWGIVALLLAALAAGFFLPALQLRGLEIARRLPTEGVVGEPLVFSYTIRAAGLLPSFGVEVFDQLGSVAGDVVPAAYFSRLSGRRSYEFRWVPPTRGRRRLDRMTVESRFPFGLQAARRQLDVPEASLTVYPALVPLSHLPLAGGSDPRAERLVTSRRGGRDELYGLRPYRPGDELRSVHWRASARTGELLVREFEHQQEQELWILLDLSVTHQAGRGSASTAEYMFCIAHSVAVQSQAQGVPVGLVYRQHGSLVTLESGQDRSSYLRLREALAVAELEESPPLDAWLVRHREDLPRGGAWLFFNLGDSATRARLAECARQRGAQPMFVEFDGATFRAPRATARDPVTTRSPGGLVCTVANGGDLRKLFVTA